MRWWKTSRRIGAARFAAVIDAPEVSGSVVALLGPDSATAVETFQSQGGVCVARAMFPPQGCALHSNLGGKGHPASGALGRGPLVVLTHDRRIVVVPDRDGNTTGDEARKRSCLAEPVALGVAADVADAAAPGAAGVEQPALARVSGYAAMYGKDAQAHVRHTDAAALRQGAAAAEARGDPADIRAVFDAPSHMLPPTSELCSGVLRAVLRKSRDAS